MIIEYGIHKWSLHRSGKVQEKISPSALMVTSLLHPPNDTSSSIIMRLIPQSRMIFCKSLPCELNLEISLLPAHYIVKS